MMDDFKLPPDLEYRMNVTTLEHMVQRTDGHKQVLLLHERELLLLWGAMCGTMVLAGLLALRLRRLEIEVRNARS